MQRVTQSKNKVFERFEKTKIHKYSIVWFDVTFDKNMTVLRLIWAQMFCNIADVDKNKIGSE